MNKEKKSGWYYDDTIILASLILSVLVCFTIGVSRFIVKGDDKIVGAFEAISGLGGLILSISTVFYVIKTYTAQKEQVRIQKDLIDSQRQEIEDNKKDVEFNRALDIVYRQLDHSKEKLKFSKYKNLLENLPYDNIDEWFHRITEIHNVINILKYETDFYIKLLSKSYLKDEDVEYLFKIYTSNLQVEVKRLFDCSLKFVNRFNVNLETRFEEYYDNNIRYEDNVYEYDNMNELLSILRTVVGKVNDIDTIFDKYNVY